MADYVTHIKTAPGTESVPIQDPNAVQRTGDTMAADLSMGGFRLTNVEEPELDTDAANKKYVDAMLPKDGGTMSGAIDMGSNQITNLADPTDDADAVNKKYVDGASPKWGLVGSWGYGGELVPEGGFKAYDELIFLYDRTNDLSFNACPPIHIPTIVLSDVEMLFGVKYSDNIGLRVKITQSRAVTYSATTLDGVADTDYTVYVYGR